LRGLHERIVLYDCHSIRSVLPRLFEGTLPVFNLGTNDGKSADPALQAMVGQIMAETGETFVVNGRFKGGWITRHYGRPHDGVHALQLEMAQRCYMDEAPPYTWDPSRAKPLIEVLHRLVDALVAWRPEQ
jgi:formiminoglutamase